jgi:hypothetical protein
MDSCLQGMVDYAQVETELAEPLFSYNSTTRTTSPKIFQILDKYPNEVILDQLVRQYAFYACVLTRECGFVNASDPGNFKFPVMLDLSTFTSDLLRGGGTIGPVPFAPDWSPSMVYYVLASLGVSNQSLPVFTPDSLRSFFVQPTTSPFLTPFLRFPAGFQHFLATFADNLVRDFDVTLKKTLRLGGFFKTPPQRSGLSFPSAREAPAVLKTLTALFLPPNPPS